MSFKERSCLHHIKVQGTAGRADVEAAAGYLDGLAKVINESSTTKEKAMAPHSSTLARKILWTEEPGGLQSMGSHRVGHD